MNRSVSLLDKTSGILFGDAGLTRDATVVVGVSGGVDSMVLLHTACALGLNVHVVHVNYHQRGDESDADEQHVRLVCKRMNVPVQVVDWRKNDMPSGNFQDVARQFRRDQYQRVMHETGGEAILLGHNRDDVYETLLMRVLRGAAPSNWNALPAVSMPFVRPLVDTTRQEILSYAKEHGVEWREDSSNQKSVYARNFLRNELIPQIDQLFPGWESNVDRIKMYGNVYRMSLDQLLVPFGDASSLPVAWLSEIPAPLNSALIHRVLERHGLPVRSTLPEQILALLDHQPGRMVEISDTVAWHRDRDAITIDLITHEPAMTLSFSLDDLAGRSITSEHGDISLGDGSNSGATFNLRAADGVYVVRPPQSGDKIAIDGGSKSITDLLNEWGVPRRLKPRTCVMTLDGSPVAVIFSHPAFGSRWRIDPAQAGISGMCIRFYLHT